MPKVVIIGAGLSGLAAAYQLNLLGIQPTLIEVKPRLGGSIHSQHQDGFIFDATAMRHALQDEAFMQGLLHQLSLTDKVTTTHTDTDQPEIIFNDGTISLVDALTAHSDFTLMQRMAVSTIGRMDAHHYSICMENGMMLEAEAVIVAAPARYAERIFHTLVPEISFRLLHYRYDAIAYISLGYTDVDDFIFDTTPPPEYPIAGIDAIAVPGRVPAGGRLLQVRLRYDPEQGLPADPVGAITALMGWPENPASDYISIWSESDPLMWHDPIHPANMRGVASLLPVGVALCGNDYIAQTTHPTLDVRIAQAMAAARRITDSLSR